MIEVEEKTAPVAAAMEKAPSTNESPAEKTEWSLDSFNDIISFIEAYKAILDRLPSQGMMDFMIDLSERVWQENRRVDLNVVQYFFDLRVEGTGENYPLEQFVYDYFRIWDPSNEDFVLRGEWQEVKDAIRVFSDRTEGSNLQPVKVCRGFDLTRFMTQWFMSHKEDPITLRLARLYAHLLHKDYSDVDYEEEAYEEAQQ